MQRRAFLVAGFAVLVLVAAWSQQAPALYEHTFEAARQGAAAVEAPGPFTYSDFVRLLVRRAGPFRVEVVRDLREWRMTPELNLWDIALPETLKLRVEGERLEVVAQPASLRLGVQALYNLPVLLRNDGAEAVDVSWSGGSGTMVQRTASRRGRV